MRFWTIAWTMWAGLLMVTLASFVVLEAIALWRGVTLSEHVWYLRNANDPLYWIIIDTVYVMAVVFIWLIAHFRFQGPPTTPPGGGSPTGV